MGSITYDGMVVHLDDRTLTHIQIVIVNKLRKGESFLMSWRDSPEVGDGRSSVWMHPNMLLQFKFDSGRTPDINQEWLDELAKSADSSRGLVVTAEHGARPEIDTALPRSKRETLAKPSPPLPPLPPE